jgi:hypothetical protein
VSVNIKEEIMSTKAKPADKKRTAKKSDRKKPMKKTAGKKLTMRCTCSDAEELTPVVPALPDLPEPPQPIEPGVCGHCHMLPAAAFELVIVMTCLVFSLSAVLMTSTQTIERQQDVIATLQQMNTDGLVRK